MKEGEKYIWIDALKGLAICGVVMTHTTRSMLPEILEKIAAFGANGVQLFFLISGFNLFSSYHKNCLIYGKDSKWWFLKRFIRLLPLYYLYLIVSLAVDGMGPRYWLGTCPEISIINIISNFLFLNGFSPYYINSIGITWYIADLAIFIILIPLFSKFIKNFWDALTAFISGIFICSFVIRLAGNFCLIKDVYLWNDYLYLCFVNQMPVILCGIVGYWFIENRMDMYEDKNATRSYRISNIVLVLFGLYLVVQLMLSRENILGIPYIYWLTVFFLILFLSGNNLNIKFINNRMFRFLGRYSYGIYFSHYLLRKVVKLIVIENNVLEFAIRYTILLFGGTIISYIVTRFIEKPSIKYLARRLEVQ